MNRFKLVFCCLLLLLTTSAIFDTTGKDNYSNVWEKNNIEKAIKSRLRISYSPIISINNNSALAEVSSYGNGSRENPYIIKDKIINGSGGEYCLLFNNISAFFRVFNCSLFNAIHGIYFNNVSNGHIEDNQIFENIVSGIYLNHAQNNTFDKNSVFQNFNGLEFFNSSFNEVFSNNLYWNDYCGLLLDQSDSNNVQGNRFLYNNEFGAKLTSSDYNIVRNNFFTNNDYAIYLYCSNFTQVKYNTGNSNGHTIVEIICKGTILEGNFESHDINDDDEEQSQDLKIKLSFTFLFLICALLTSIILYSSSLARHFFNYKSNNNKREKVVL